MHTPYTNEKIRITSRRRPAPPQARQKDRCPPARTLAGLKTRIRSYTASETRSSRVFRRLLADMESERRGLGPSDGFCRPAEGSVWADFPGNRVRVNLTPDAGADAVMLPHRLFEPRSTESQVLLAHRRGLVRATPFHSTGARIHAHMTRGVFSTEDGDANFEHGFQQVLGISC